ncbi:MAG: manganese-dependent inorganic pyrophosphatase [Sulfurimonas sp.]|uniref:manganese-dependent inorganic pyrophosphatase n=1 Tax=Sulfurimonas sp. TaxID=2022749 RepID=UPI00260280DB|nr:manganese-dependent inorganic pyrophosphatase [Sulfurimonas sp.]MCW8894499.1 manganese-dependent inorganic pyrophosphatase [Sulfurimonas sp.]MCW8955145.1 manganese-dependent inorganic pyrophosphatase [Sulfurimonas sp.]MCW9067760.1 manganese-dependent inorganic pyrophosphatase [Sulfurimonas sp.]
MSTYIFGHTNPDSDSIIGAISLSYLKNQLGEDCIPTRQGDISAETQFILNKFDGELPELKTSVAGESVYIVDFSDKAQAPKDIMEATILGIVDHHKLGDLTTDTPLECWIRPIGCTNTIIKEMYDYHGVEIPKNIAGMMLCAILSDTVIFKSPTCTKIDTKAVKELAKIAGVEDYKALGMEMFIVKSAVAGATARELNTRDYKEFEMGSDKLGVGQLEVVDLSVFDDIKYDLFKDMKKLKEEGGLHSVLILLTDIMKEGSQLLVVSDDESKIETAFKCKLENSQVWLDGVLSRKKQVIPFLQAQF